MNALQDHPIAAVFPLLEGESADALAGDIAANGQREPIVIFEDKILDGRNRYRACVAAGIQPATVEYDGTDPFSFVVSVNIHRRHLTTSQRAMIAAELANMRHGGDRCAEQDPILDLATRADAAEKLNVSRSLVSQAAVVKTHGTPELQEAVRRGQMSVSAAAKIARPPTTRTVLETADAPACEDESQEPHEPEHGTPRNPLAAIRFEIPDKDVKAADADQLRRMKKMWRKTELSDFWAVYTPENKRALLAWIEQGA